MSKVLIHYGTVFKLKASCIAALESGTSPLLLGLEGRSSDKIRYDLPMYFLLGQRGQSAIHVAVEQDEIEPGAESVIYKKATVGFTKGTTKKKAQENDCFYIVERLRTGTDFDRILAKHSINASDMLDDFRIALLKTKQYCELKEQLATKRLLVTFSLPSWKRNGNTEATLVVNRIAGGQIYGFVTTEADGERYREDSCYLDDVASYRILEPNEIEELLVSASSTVRNLVYNENYPAYKEAQKKIRRLKFAVATARTRLQKSAHKLVVGRFFTRIKDKELRATVTDDYKQTLRSINWDLIDKALAELDKPFTEALQQADRLLISKGAQRE